MAKKIKKFEHGVKKRYRGMPYTIDRREGVTVSVRFPFLGSNDKAIGPPTLFKFSTILKREFGSLGPSQLKMYADSGCGLSVSFIGRAYEELHIMRNSVVYRNPTAV